MRAAWLVMCLGITAFAGPASALDDTSPRLRWGVLAGVGGSVPVGDVRASGASRDEFTPALWLELEPLQFDIGSHLNLAPVARFILLGGVDSKAADAALDPARRTANGKKLDEPEVSALELGLKARYFPWGDGTFRPYAGLQFSYSTVGFGYTSTKASSGMTMGAPAAPTLEVHRHQGVGTKLVLGVRWDVPMVVFNTALVAPVAFELSYTHNTWLNLRRDSDIEIDDSKLAGEGPFVDYLGASLLVGFLR